MLELKNITKTYKVGEYESKALNDISVSFREKEMVAILGVSGSGKTTCLNIIGGLDHYDSGEMIIKGKNTKNFEDKDWDAYRNNSIGFVFQSYNLITHLSIVANVELSMTLSGVGAKEKHARAIQALKDVGLSDHLHKKPNQLSGGQMQRVAIARALVNNPEILLCDEPTGALDTETSIQILDLIKEISKERLVIMVTHNPELAERYADRIIKFKDGKITSDSNPYYEPSKPDSFSLKKTSMNFFTALNLSFNNIKTKMGRTFLTALASSIGIIGIAVILSLSSGFQTQIDKFQSDTMAEFPIIVSQTAMVLDRETMKEQSEAMNSRLVKDKEEVESDEVFIYDSSAKAMQHINKISDEYISFIKNIDPAICETIGYTRIVNMNLLRKTDDSVIPVSLTAGFNLGDSGSAGGMGMGNMQMAGLTSYPSTKDSEGIGYLEKYYELLSGSYPADETQIVLIVNSKNRVEASSLKSLGFDTEDIESIKFEDIIGTQIKMIPNNDYYIKTPYGTYYPNFDYKTMYESDNAITLTVSGILRSDPDKGVGILSTGFVYSDALSERVVEIEKNSDIVKEQESSMFNVLLGSELDNDSKDMFMAYLGGNAMPIAIMVYPKTFEDKDAILAYLDTYNEGKETADKMVYSDLSGTITEMSGGIMSAITIVLIAFAAVSLVVSLIMVSIITYTSVLERTKEIGILKALGARKKDITHVFDAETFIVGIFSGSIGILIAWLLVFPINHIIYSLTDLPNVARLNPLHALILVTVSTLLSMMGGHIPAIMASKRDAVEALRSE